MNSSHDTRESGGRTPHLRRRAVGLIGVLLVGATLLWAVHAAVLRAASDFLVVEDPLARSDLIYVLNGDVHLRPFYAAELYHKRLSPRVVLPRVKDSPAVRIGVYPNETDAAAAILRRLDVPDSAISILPSPGGVTSTWDEALVLRRFLDEHPVQRVTVVTSAFHTRRTRWVLRRVLAGMPVEVSMAPVRDPGYTRENWWKTEGGLITHLNEYLKLLHYQFNHRGGAVSREG